MQSIVDTVVLQTITTGEITTWIDRLDNSVIDPALEPHYAVPITQITRGTTYYPYPITEISAHLAAGVIVAEILAQGEPQISERGVALQQQAMEWLEGLRTNRTRLEGQRRKGNIHFRSPRLNPQDVVPVAAPTTPTIT